MKIILILFTKIAADSQKRFKTKQKLNQIQIILIGIRLNNRIAQTTKGHLLISIQLNY